ncbi:hypothetical protein KY363_08060 [Candidatus Woesearchaeota archaeon]|nr:hypothetical protein [Candidatus Woesearchaeota archaeon]
MRSINEGLRQAMREADPAHALETMYETALTEYIESHMHPEQGYTGKLIAMELLQYFAGTGAFISDEFRQMFESQDRKFFKR